MPIGLINDELWAASDYAVSDVDQASGAASITVTPASGEFAHVDWFSYSFDDDPGIADYVTVTIGGTEIFRWRPGEVTSVQGPQIIGPFVGEIDEVIVIAAQIPNAGDTVALSCKYRQTAEIT